jgi:hypothetical protein
MGRLALVECSVRGCEALKADVCDGVEVALPSQLCRRGQALSPLWCCCNAHAVKVRAALAGDLARGRKEAGDGANADESDERLSHLHLRDLLRLTVQRGEPDADLLWRLVSIVSPAVALGLRRAQREVREAELEAGGRS